MRILHIITTLDRGGAENQLLTLAKEQVALGNKVEVIYLKGHAELIDDFNFNGIVQPILIANMNPIIQVFKLKRFLSHYNGILHAHLPRAEIVARISLNSQPFFVSRHYGERFWPNRPIFLSNFASKFVLQKCRSIIAISNFVESYLKSSGELLKKSKIEVIPYALNREFLLNLNIPLKTEYLKLIENKFVIGTVSRLSPEKDLKTFISTVGEISKYSDNFIGVIIGGGPQELELKAFVDKHHLENKVIFLGRTENIAAYLKTFNVFLLTSLFEGFGLVLLEAMASGLPVIATRTGSIPEVIGNNGPGILVNLGDFAGISKEVLNLSLSPDLISTLSKQGVERAKEFDPIRMALKMNSLYVKSS